MKNRIYISIIIFGLCFLGSNITFAMKQIPFPDAKSLQPMPSEDIQPNISGNVNSGPNNIYNKNLSETASEENIYPTNPEVTPEESVSTESLPTDEGPESSHFLAYTIFLVVILAVVIFLIKNKSNSLLDN